MFREKNDKWTCEREEIKARLDGLESNRDERIELLEGAEKTWENAKKETKARIVKILVSNAVLENGSLRFEMKKPFDLLAKGSSKFKWWTLAAKYRTFFSSNPHFNPFELLFLNPSGQSSDATVTSSVQLKTSPGRNLK